MKSNVRLWLAFTAIYVIWGTTYLAVKIAIEDIPPFLMAAIRYFLAAILLLSYCIVKGEKIFSKNAVINLALGAFIMTFGQAVACWAEKFISSGLTAVFGSLLPVCYVIADTKQWKRYKKSKQTLVSIVLGTAGVIILFITTSGTSPEKHATLMMVLASAAAVASCFCWAAGSLYFKYHDKRGSLYENVGWQLSGGMICCILISLVTGEWHHFYFTAVTPGSWLAVLYLAIAGSIIALISLYWLLKRRPAAVVGTYAYVNPVIAVILGCLIANEKITFIQVIGMFIILTAAYIANRVKLEIEESG